MSTLKAVRGTRDLLPPETEIWNRVEATARAVFGRYGFGEIRTPMFEATELFVRGVGEETDVVSKEMYTWEDGERFSKEKLRGRWLETQDSSSVALISPFGIDCYLTPDTALFNGPSRVYVNFRVKPDKRAANELLDAAIASPNFSTAGYQCKLVVTDRGRSKGEPDHFQLEEGRVDVEVVNGSFSESSQSLTLRPENTAGVVRAYIEHKLGDGGGLQKLFYIGPQFRRERPQRGRYRQFWQIGAEVLGPVSSGAESAIRDAEVLEMLASLLNELGVKGWRLEINSVGSSADRPRYVAALREALAPVKDQMCEDNRRRAETNPLRVLDSKAPEDQKIIEGLPKIADFLDEASKQHFAQVLAALDACGVAYTVNPRLVRGLDYYTRTTFEFTVPASTDTGSGLGTQNALLGGGRYDGLSEMLGGPKAPGIGFAIGEDRLILTLQAQASAETKAARKLDTYIAPMGVERNAAALVLARELRRAGLSVELGDGNFRLKKSFEAAEKIARCVVLLGEDEMASGLMTVKTFATGEQVKVERGRLTSFLDTLDKQA